MRFSPSLFSVLHKFCMVAILLTAQAFAKSEDPAQLIPSQELRCELIPAFQSQVEKVKKSGSPLDSMTPSSVAQMRADRDKLASHILGEIKVEKVEPRKIPAANKDHEIPVRVYTPSGRKSADDHLLPVVVFIHGGGWTLGSLETYDSIARGLANAAAALVVSVDYRLAPTFPFPAGLNDVYDVLHWLHQHAAELKGDPRRLAVAGDSGGGNLATVAAMKARDLEDFQVIAEALFYPSTNISSTETASYKEFGTNYPLTKKSVELFRGFYLPQPTDWKNPYASPLLAEDLHNMPATFLVTAGCDELRDEGRDYAAKLARAGVPVAFKNEPGMMHAYLNYYNYDKEGTPYGETTLRQAGEFLRKEFQKENKKKNKSGASHVKK